jgi:hypothetical protein
MQELLFIVGFFLFFYLLGKFKVIDISALDELVENIKNGFKSDYQTVKEKGFAGIKKNRWHLHGLVGLGTAFTALISVFDIQSFDSFWQQFVLITLGSFMIQAGREFVLGLFKGSKADFSDARFGAYATMIGMIAIKGASCLIELKDIHYILMSALIYFIVAYLVYVKKQ